MTEHRPMDLLTIGETMGLLVAEETGPVTTVNTFRLRIGGSESNVAIGASRLGARVRWVSRLGADGLGDRIERTIRGEGVEVVVRRDPDAPTGLMLKERRAATHTNVSYYRGGSAAASIGADDIDDMDLRNARVLHLTGITGALSPSARDAVVQLARRGRTAGCVVSFDINFRSKLTTRENAALLLRELISSVDLLFGGLDEVSLLDASIVSAEDAWRVASTAGVSHLVVKDGANGAHAFSDDAAAYRPAYTVSVVDTVGAGDAFVAGYLTAWLEGHDMATCLDRGARSGALVCMVIGDWEGAPTHADLALFDAGDSVDR